jgi:large subunit ribosomal protein L32
MPVPKRKRSKSRRDKRFANKGMEVKTIATCRQCNAPTLPHQVCATCGFYKGVKVVATKLDRSIKRVETRQSKAANKKSEQETAQAE